MPAPRAPKMRNGQIARLFFYDELFRNPVRDYTYVEIQKTYNEMVFNIHIDENNRGRLSKRQLILDLNILEAEPWNANLVRKQRGREVAFTYEDHSFSIRNNDISQYELELLKQIHQSFGMLRGFPQFEWMEEVFVRLNENYNLLGNNKAVLEIDQNIDAQGLENLNPIYNSILNKQVLKITYRPFNSVFQSIYIVHPYYLKQFNNRWFLFAFQEDFNKNDEHIINLPLDRIMSFDVLLNEKYIENDKIDFTEYFEDIIGVTKISGKSCEKVKLKIDRDRYQYILSKPMHSSQKELKVEGDSNFAVIELDVIPNNELEALILHYGDDIEVLEPLSLRNRMKERYENALKKYQ